MPLYFNPDEKPPEDAFSQEVITLALGEDLLDVGDLTSQFFLPRGHRSVARILSREEAVLSGIEVAEAVFHKLDPDVEFRALHRDGDRLAPGTVACEISGPTRSLLTAERTALNFLQRLCGIATMARAYSERVSHTKARILDTRKTTPGLRVLEKAAVVHGGASNHRMGLHDAVMVKDNHLVASAKPRAIANAISNLHAWHPGTPVILEADRLDQVAAFLSIEGVSSLLLDNMSPDQLREAVRLRDEAGSDITLEASGGITLDTVAAVAETGVDFISVGALTHSVRSIDLGLDLVSANG